MKRIVILFLILLNLLPVGAQDSRLETPDSLLAEMSLEQKVGQLFMVSIYGKNLPEAGANLIADYHVGAVALFAYNTDFQPVGEVAKFINAMQAVSVESGGIPLIIAIDHEGGRVRRLVNDVTRFPDPMAFGAVPPDDAETVRWIGELTGIELRAVGINMNLAPVADLYTRPDLFDKNRVLHRRTLGDDPQRVGLIAAAYSQGLTDGGVISVLKHFPGHGGTVDSHQTLPVVEMDRETALAQPIESFRVAIQQEVPAVMMGHLYYSELESVERLPASLSPTLNQILRDDLGFDGLVMTDAMDMAAIAGNYSIPEAGVMAMNAGVDMIVMGPNVSWGTQQATIRRMIEAVQSGEVSEARLDEALGRILALKADFDLLDWTENDPASVAARIDLLAADEALLRLYEQAGTVVKNEGELLPLAPDDDVVIVYPAIYENILKACREQAPDARYYGYTFFPTEFDFNSISRLGIRHHKLVMFVEDSHKHLAQRDLVRLLDPSETVIVALSSPYDLELFPDVAGYLAMYTSLPASHIAACRLLFGAVSSVGTLPISLSDYPTGSGLLLGD